MSNIAYVSYGVTDVVQSLNPYWQQLSQWGSSVSYAGDALTVALHGGTPSNEWGGVVGLAPITLENSSVAVQVSPGNAANSGDAVWAGIQMATAQPVIASSNGDPTNSACYPLVRLVINQGDLWFGEVTGGGTTVWDTATYDPVNHKFIRLAGNGTSYIEAGWSPDGITWTNGWGASLSPVGVFYYPELLTYTASGIASTASFSNYVYGYEPYPASSISTAAVGIHIPVTVTGGAPAVPTVTVSAVILDSTNAVVSATGNGLPEIAVPFNYNDTADVIRAYVTDAVRAAAGDYSLQVIFA